jgi:hypothetical protein
MHIDSSGVDAFSALQSLAKHLNNQSNVERYLSVTSTKEVNQLASLMVGQLDNPESRDLALTILINLTCCSLNTCIYLSDVF